LKLLRFRINATKAIEIGILTDLGVFPLNSLLDTPISCMKDLFRIQEWDRLIEHEIPSNTQLVQKDKIEILAPIARPGKILCVGLNYRDHVLEGGREIPKFPTIFMKASSSVIGQGQPIQRPHASSIVDIEAELAVVIGKTAKNVSANQAYDVIAGYTILNDVSERDYQKRTAQWTMGKSCDTFAPMGPVIVTKDEIPDPHTLSISSSLNGFEMQSSNSKHLIFTVPFLIEYISAVMTLEPGDVIATGTPGGVGVFRDPPIFLKSGDKVEVKVEGIGSLCNPVA
jgi:acylpyruvate hydrolase